MKVNKILNAYLNQYILILKNVKAYLLAKNQNFFKINYKIAIKNLTIISNINNYIIFNNLEYYNSYT